MFERPDASAMRGSLKMKHFIVSIVVSIIALISFPCIASEHHGMVTEADLWVFFNSIEREGTNFVLTARRSFLYSVDGKDDWDDKFSKAGEKIILPEGSELVAVERHRSMKFSPTTRKNGRKGFSISQRTNHRGVVKIGLAHLLPADETPDPSGGEKGIAAPEGNRAMPKSAGTPEKGAERKCLKGLTLLPCEEKEQ